LGAADVTTHDAPASLLAFLRARYVFTTHVLYPVRAPKRQVAVNLWHGEFTKRLDVRPVPRGLRGKTTTATSRLGATLRSVEFEVAPTRILVVGNPRNDQMLRCDRAEARAELGLAADELMVLWLPTYRLAHDGIGREAAPSPNAADLGELGQWLDRRHATLVIKAHPLAPAIPSPGSPRIRIIDDSSDGPATSVGRLMAASDCLITDFSSAWSDYLLLDRPIWIHWPDHARWVRDDQLPLAPLERWAPGPVTVTIDELVTQLDGFADGDDAWAPRRDWLRAVLHRHTDAHSTQRLLDELGVPN
jgi:CDP-glycerol glycerophosphotransferase (TagB/SpsB family)